MTLLTDQFRTGNQGALRRQNLSDLMHHLYDSAPISRAELVKITGLNKATVSSLIAELIETRCVLEAGIGESNGVGRRSLLLDVNPARGCIVSGEIGADFVSVICANFATEIVWREKENREGGGSPEAVIARTVELLRAAQVAGCAKGAPLLGLALGVPGLVNLESGTLLYSTNLEWRNIPLQEIISRHFQTTVYLDNSATLAALGEQYFGVAEGYRDVLYLNAGVGLGGGMVLEGRLYGGAAGFASEFGHMTMDPEGELCKCGNRGCWETQVGQSALFRQIRQAIEGGAASRLAEMVNDNPDQLTVQIVAEAARSGDSVALAALQQVGRHLGIGIASLVNALNPELVVLGGTLSEAGDLFMETVRDEVGRRALYWNRETARIEIAKYEADATVMGGIARICQSVLANPAQQAVAAV